MDDLGLTAELVIDDPAEFLGQISDIAYGEYDPAPGLEIVVAGANGMAIYNSEFQELHRAIIKRPNDPEPVQPFALNWFARYYVVDADNDGTPEFIGSDDLANVHVLRNSDGSVRWSLAPTEYPGYPNLAGIWNYPIRDWNFGDVDGDGDIEFLLFSERPATAVLLGDFTLFDHELLPLWTLQHLEIAWMADVDGDGDAEILTFNSNGTGSAYQGDGTLLDVVDNPHWGFPVRYPPSTETDSFFEIECTDDMPRVCQAMILDFEGNILLDLELPVSRARRAVVKFRPDAEPFLVGATWSNWVGTAFDGTTVDFLRIHDVTGKLRYDEVKLGRNFGMTAIPSRQSGAEDLLFGADNKVWRYTAFPNVAAR